RLHPLTPSPSPQRGEGGRVAPLSPLGRGAGGEGETNSLASQSSSSGCVGGVPRLPKLLVERTMPRPKWCCQTRLTITRAVSGLSLLAIQFANASRRPEVLASGPRSGITGAGGASTDKKPGSTSSPFACGLPRCSTNVLGGAGPASVTHSACASAAGGAL